MLYNIAAVKDSGYMNGPVMKAFMALPYIKILIYVLLLAIMALLIMRIFKIKTIFKGRGITSEIANVEELKSRDKYVLRSNKFLRRITNIVQKTPFTLSQTAKDYIQYNLDRAGVKAPGGMRYLAAEEFNAVIQISTALIVAVALLIAIFLNTILGVVLITVTIISTSTLPTLILRSTVAEKDREIKENFADLYLMLHYVLILGGNTPIDKIMKSYVKTTSSEEMKRFIETCTNHIDTYGEYNATRMIAKDYREIAEVGKLMRLIRQQAEGGTIEQDLIGFKNELLQSKKYALAQRRNKLVKKARLSFKILGIVLVQAIISAMIVYLPDLSLIKSLFGIK